MYATAERLLAHMLDKHSVIRWSCNYCVYDKGINGSSNGEPCRFDTSQEWNLHIAANHRDIVPFNQQGTLAELQKELTIGPLSCPLCQFTTEFADTKIDSHILQHLHEFSLRALPEGAEQNDDKESTTSRASGLLSHMQFEDVNAFDGEEQSIVTSRELQRSLNRARNLLPDILPSGESLLLPSLIFPLPDANNAEAENYQSKVYKLKCILDGLINAIQMNDTDILPDLSDMASEAITEINSMMGASSKIAFIHDTLNRPKYISVPPLDRTSAPRDEILDELENIFFFSEQRWVPRTALIGPKGCGTTTVAKMFVERIWEQTEDCSIFWVDASFKAGINRSYEIIAQEFGPTADPTEDLIKYLTWTYDKEWIVVFDGLQYRTAAYLAFENILPQGLKGRLLFTTSDPGCLALLGPVKTIHVPKLDDEILTRFSVPQGPQESSWGFSPEKEVDFQQYLLKRLKHRFKEANGTLCEQIAKSMFLRRERLKSRLRNQKKLVWSQGYYTDFISSAKAENRGEASQAGHPQSQAPAPTEAMVHLPLGQKPLLGFRTNAPAPNIRVYREPLREDTVPEAVISQPIVTQGSRGYPLPPVGRPGRRGCACPYCGWELFPDEMQTEKQWKDHVDKDLEPYSCISEKCESSPIQFAKHKDWFRHMNTHGPSHRAWDIHLEMFCCPICRKPFRWREDFFDHMTVVHTLTLTREELIRLSRRNTVKVRREPYICPLCSLPPSKIEDIPPEDRYERGKLLSRHIAGHLLSLAFKTLPSRDDEMDDNDDEM
ncbi:hypothetical protein TWF694_006047 [Orbilia ellipsospora]|uniref:C2H2-type domain-containing protein n=1 Tax=Orbilia ellipsospora TaxID=2528407 RepID=A0AAV9WT61_9PEZI